MSLLPLDGPSKQSSISLSGLTVVEVKVGTPFSERKVITIQPLDSNIYVYFGDGASTPSVATVAADGFLHFKKARESYECGELQQLFILSADGVTSVRIAERA